MKKSILLILIVSIIFSMGCDIDNNIQSKDDGEGIGYLDVAASDSELLNTSEDMADSVVELYGIDDAAAIVLNDNALVAIVLADGQEMTDDMNETIVATIKKDNPQIEEVHISLNEKIFKQTGDIVIDLLQGKSYDDYVDEISKMIDKVKREK